MSTLIYDAIRATAEREPNAVIFTFLEAGLNESVYTQERLHNEAERIARQIAAFDPDPDFPVGILFHSQESQVLNYVAVLSLGLRPAILTPPNRKLNRAYYLETMNAILGLCRFSKVLTDVPEIGAPTAEVSSSALLPDTAFVQFSSGTTGIKRGVEISHQAALAQIDTYSRAIELTREDRIVSWLPLYHDMGFMTSLNMALVCGIHSVMMQPADWVTDPGMYCRAVSRTRATLGWNPNFAYAFMADRVRQSDLADVDLSSLRGLVNCSEPVTHESQHRFRSRFKPYGLRDGVFWGCYAMAETTFALTHGISEDTSVGEPLNGVELKIREDTRELWIKSPFTMSRYYNNPAATADAFHHDWYKSGDLGRCVGDRLYVCGRKKDMLIIAGENYFPEDLEAAVSAMPGIRPGRVCAFAQFHSPSQTERAVILAEASDPSATLLLSARQQVASRFQLTQFDVHFVSPGWLIKSSAGKMARGLNREKWLKRALAP
jgi:acyl-CoA synthetase (AMP-forming)/AMP-acid ligase II